MVTWGTNTTHTFNSAPSSGMGFAPAAAQPAPSSNAPAPSAPFGSPAPAPTAGGGTNFFGTSSPAPAGGGGFFAAPAPGASGGGAFGQTQATSPWAAPSSATFGTSGGMFGSSSSGTSSFFGSSNTTGSFAGFGAPQQQQQQQQAPQQPAAAAFEAHQQAQARQVMEQLNSRLRHYYSAYEGTKAAPSETESAPFTTVVYNPASTVYQMQVQNITGRLGNQAARPLPDRPSQISVKDWEIGGLHAPQDYQPVDLVGAAALQTRLSGQQQQADNLKNHIKHLREFQKHLKERKEAAAQEGLAVKKERLHKERKQRLWQIMQKLEIIRAYGHPIQQAEGVAMQHAARISSQVEAIASQPLPNTTAVKSGMPRMVSPSGQEPVDPKAVVKVLEEHRQELFLLSSKLKKNLRDTKLLTERLKE